MPSDMNAAYLWAQLEQADEINQDRMGTWNYYYNELKYLQEKGMVELPVIPEECIHNAHMFYVKLKNLSERTAFITYLRDKGVQSTFHYIPLHSAPAGEKFGRFHGEDQFTTSESERLTRLPMYYGIGEQDRKYVVDCIKEYFG